MGYFLKTVRHVRKRTKIENREPRKQFANGFQKCPGNGTSCLKIVWNRKTDHSKKGSWTIFGHVPKPVPQSENSPKPKTDSLKNRSWTVFTHVLKTSCGIRKHTKNRNCSSQKVVRNSFRNSPKNSTTCQKTVQNRKQTVRKTNFGHIPKTGTDVRKRTENGDTVPKTSHGQFLDISQKQYHIAEIVRKTDIQPHKQTILNF